MSKKYKISVIGLGYVGLPLAVALSLNHEVIGFDIKSERVNQIERNEDITGELDYSSLANSKLKVTSNLIDIYNSEIFIITVPTPIDESRKPNLDAVFDATVKVGEALKVGDIVVYESTVYPGVTEDECGPILEDISGLKCGKDFHLGYSPERINPGDKEHTLSNITKVISGQNITIINILKDIYGSINKGNIFVAKNIKTAEAAKVIENTQRDINIAFVNEISIIFNQMGLSTLDILETARTKWNFLDFRPGLVGGHCIGVDPYYLAFKAQSIGINPEVILAGRKINDAMGSLIAHKLSKEIKPETRVLILGITFKENVPDIRNTKVIDIVEQLEKSSFVVDISDPVADINDVKNSLHRELVPLPKNIKYSAIIIAVSHKEFFNITNDYFNQLLDKDGLILDLKGILKDRESFSGLNIKQI